MNVPLFYYIDYAFHQINKVRLKNTKQGRDQNSLQETGHFKYAKKDSCMTNESVEKYRLEIYL